ncbi:TPA: glycosyltransferase family 1 protein [Candidatus Berkelbacteria bacterium]|uniref:Group 1 glycosyl transferase n=1 Tax=Berkelbacteria bacterium GW2011_GWE1_39_12 TaxID=1618337 RepID=A0A0G4B595_9BACT|nr:MAG: group 1 glycosyl transferase [Berkelbacteria bacterium GW2011_GWE1_39_12]HBO60760.1 glycosyltransferase family 1 protein [Candidatus Berkelbacteria bacterium]
MRIAIDTQTILGQKSGFGFYVKNLVENLNKIDPENEYILIAPDTDKDFSTPQRFIWDQFRFPKRARKAKVDILHQPCFSAPILYRGKIIVTIHDIISIKFPENLPLASRLFYSKWMPFSYRKADMIIVDSEHTKKDIVEYLNIAPEKIRVMYWAVSHDFRPIFDLQQVEDVKKKYNTGEKYFIHVGTLEPRKNLPFLVRVYASAVKEGIKENLVIVGKKGWYYDDLFSLVGKLELSSKVIFTGYAEDKDIPALYSGATALTFPSLYEGFGFPPLEAMACGTPVISSNTSSLPEVVGEAGMLLPPHGSKGWTDAMVKLSSDVNLCKELSEKGLEQASKFSWEETAKKTVEVYKEVFNAK